MTVSRLVSAALAIFFLTGSAAGFFVSPAAGFASTALASIVTALVVFVLFVDDDGVLS